MTIDDQTDLADRFLDENKFGLARDEYRRAFMTNPELGNRYGNLAIAEEAEALHFRQELASRHPTSTAARLALAHEYLRAHKPKQAVDTCAELLSGALPNEIAVRMLRFRAAVVAGRFDVAELDFVQVWRLGAENRGARALRDTLLREIAGISKAADETFFSNIIAVLSDEADLATFLQAKAAELRILRTILRER